MHEYTTDSEDKIVTGGIKYDGGKAPIWRGALSYFPKAIEAVAEVSQFGANKYAWKGWEKVDDGFNRYSDALLRHLSKEAVELYDLDSKLLHAQHTAWNALARLELLLRELGYTKCHTSIQPTDTTSQSEDFLPVPQENLTSYFTPRSSVISTTQGFLINPLTTSSVLLSAANKKSIDA